MTASPLSIRLLGFIQMEVAGRSLSPPSSTSSCSLLGYLVLNRGQVVSRSRLAGLFWPERAEVPARRALSQALWQIRTSLDSAADRLSTEGERIVFSLGPDDWLDVAAFETLLATASHSPPLARVRALQAAVDLYQEDLLADLYDDWCLLDRERLRARYLKALEDLLTLHKRHSHHHDALGAALRLVAADPLRESARREVMRLTYLLGRPRAALAQFEDLRALLAEAFHTGPMPATLALYREILADLDESAAPYLPVEIPPPLAGDLTQLPFVGRQEERSRLLQALKAAIQGHGGVAIVRGAAGVGKSRLIHEVVADAEWRGIQVGVAKVTPLGAVPPYQLLRAALSSLLTPLRIAQLSEILAPRWLSALAPLFPALQDQIPGLPSLPPMDLHAEWQRLWDALVHGLQALTAIAPLMLVLEDVHWADNASLAALPHLAAHLADMPLLLLVTSRVVEAQARPLVLETLEATGRNAPLTRVTLSPFTSEEVAALLQRALGTANHDAAAAALAERLEGETGGNALYLLESLKLLLEQGVLERGSEGRWQFPERAVFVDTPASLRALVRQRVSRLPDATREVLEVIAVLGEDASFRVVSAVRTMDASELAQRLETLGKRGFLQPTAEGYRFEHDLVRSEVYHTLIPARRRRWLHRWVAEALETIFPQEVELLAEHFELAGAIERAIPYLLQAADRAQALYDYETATMHYRRALVGIEDPSARWDVLSDLEEALDVRSRRDDQRAVLDEMFHLAESMGDLTRQAHTRQRQGWWEVLAGQAERARMLLEEAIQMARTSGAKNLLGDCFVSMARMWWNMGAIDRCQAAIEEARTLFEETEDARGLSRVFNMLGNMHLGLTGDFSQALASFDAHRCIRQEVGDRYGEARARGNLGITYYMLGCYHQALTALEEAEGVIVQVGDRLWQGIIRLGQADCHYQLRHPDRSMALAETSLQLCQAVGNTTFEIECLRLLGQIAMDFGDMAHAVCCFQRAITLAEAGRHADVQACLESHLALAYLNSGRLGEADRLSAEAMATLDTLGSFNCTKDVSFARYRVVAAIQGADAAHPHLKRAHRLLMAQAAKIGDSTLREAFLHNVRSNRAILLAHRLGRAPFPVRFARVQLPCATAPTGRPLTDDEILDAIWTVAAPEDDETGGKVDRRRHRILRLLKEAEDQGADATVEALAEALGVSARTIKRDLAALRDAGHKVSTRGSRAS